MKAYKSYLFVDKDPVIDALRTIIQDEGVPLSRIEADSGVTAQTLRNWFEGDTKRPQHATVAAVAKALRYDVVFQKGRKRVTT